MAKGYSVRLAANGFCCIETQSLLKRWRLGLLLIFRYGFGRQGKWVLLWHDAIHPDFVRANLRILSAWNHWFRYFPAGR